MSSASSPLLDFRDVSRSFTVRQGVLGRVRGEVRAVDGVSLSVRRGETLGLVGESGCGKSTLARMAVRLLPPTGGEILFDGESVLPGVSGRNDTWYSRRLQMIFQDPFSSLNPRYTVERIIAEGGASGACGRNPAPRGVAARTCRTLPARVFRRPEAACGDCTGTGDPPGACRLR